MSTVESPPTKTTETPAYPEVTLGQFIASIAPAYWPNPSSCGLIPSWPPDTFAIVASILHDTAAYRLAAEHWPPPIQSDDKIDLDDLRWEEWIDGFDGIGAKWRRAWPDGPLPSEVNTWWDVIAQHHHLPFCNVCSNQILCTALLQLSAAADEACRLVGLVTMDEVDATLDEDGEPVEDPDDSENPDPLDFPFLRHAGDLLNQDGRPSSLCERIDPSRAKVLPKIRTSQRGLTLRSFSLNICLCPSGEVKPVWRMAPIAGPKESYHYLNLLAIPWPFDINPVQFEAIKRDTYPTKILDKHGFFRFRILPPDDVDSVCDQIKTLLKSAEAKVGRIDGVILPESSVTPKQFEKLQTELIKLGVFLIAGIVSEADVKMGRNSVKMAFPQWIDDDAEQVETQGEQVGPLVFEQFKHHRWALDRDQIATYGLAAQLDPSMTWWEAMEIKEREVQFYVLEDWLTLSVLICEDLARQDPIGEILRTVGPNLVIALLMDGPQLSTRWPNRYAAVLADDPGSAVLILTSLGMCKLSRPFDKQAPSRTVALWKDQVSGAVEIELPNDAHGLVLSLYNEEIDEYSADNRCDDYKTYRIRLGGIHPV
jgi:hypothetical protein